MRPQYECKYNSPTGVDIDVCYEIVLLHRLVTAQMNQKSLFGASQVIQIFDLSCCALEF